MSRPKVLCVVPLPPPWAGVEKISALLIESKLREKFDLDVLKSNVRTSNAAKGAWDAQGIIRVFWILARLALRMVFKRPRLVYMTLSQNPSGLARDLAYLGICRPFRVRVVAHLHGSMLGTFLDSISPLIRWAVLKALSSIGALVVCAESIRIELSRRIPGVPVFTVYNACPPVDLSGSSGTYSEKEGGVVVAFMGHLSFAKGFYDLLEAAKIVLKKMPRIRFEFAGERLDVERNVRSSIRQGDADWSSAGELFRAYPGNFHLNGIVTGATKEEFLRKADIFVLPSHSEAFPVSVLEAMQAELPLVTTCVGALPEVLREGENALFVPAGDARSLADRIARLANDPSLRRAMGQNNAKLVRRFTRDAMADEMGRIFSSVS